MTRCKFPLHRHLIAIGCTLLVVGMLRNLVSSPSGAETDGVKRVMRLLVSVTTATKTDDVTVSAASMHTQNAASFNVAKERRRRLPQAIIIGAKKCGTGAVVQYLRAHPSVALGEWEVHYFDKPDNDPSDLEAYRQRMPFSRDDQVTMEDTPAYFTTPGVVKSIKAMNSSIKILLIVRNPVTRIFSDYTHNRWQQNGADLFKMQMSAKRIRQLEATFGANGMPTFEWLVFHNDVTNGSVDNKTLIVRTGMYAAELKRWFKYFPHSQIHIVDGDELIKAPWQPVYKIETFLNIPHVMGTSERFEFVETKGFYCMKNSTGHPQCLSKGKGRKHPKYSDEIIHKLKEFYRPHNEEFFSLIGKRFDW